MPSRRDVAATWMPSVHLPLRFDRSDDQRRMLAARRNYAGSPAVVISHCGEEVLRAAFVRHAAEDLAVAEYPCAAELQRFDLPVLALDSDLHRNQQYGKSSANSP